MTCASIGGGDSNTGMPGAVSSENNATISNDTTNAGQKEDYGVNISGGTITTGSIGGGTNENENGAIGFATAHISGGNIQGQFVLENTDPGKTCKFTMTGGTIDNANLDNGGFTRTQNNGGAVYLSDSDGEVTISGGTIRNSTGLLGGAIYMLGGTVTIKGTGLLEACSAFKTNVADSSGSVGGNGGAVYLASGKMKISGGAIRNNHADMDGAGVYLANGTLEVTGGTIQANTAGLKGGGAYIQGGSFTLNGSGAQIADNRAGAGAGVFLTGGTPELKQGTISGNQAERLEGDSALSGKGGGIYIEKQHVVLNPAGQLSIRENSATDGAGIYMEGDAGEEDASLTMSPDKISQSENGNVVLSGNFASGTGGAVCILNGSFTQNSNRMQITGNKAYYGGGVAVLGGNFQLSSGVIGGSNGTNAAEYGGGVYVSGGNVTLDKEGSIAYNAARINGGGIFVKDGDVLMYQGSITDNKASGGAGGGIYVNAENADAKVVMLSGAIESNHAHTSGGGMAAQSGSEHNITVQIGTENVHENLNLNDRTFTPFNYEDRDEEFKSHKHSSCPVIRGNQAGTSGGAFYLNSTGSKFQFFCLTETGNKAKDGKSNGLKVEGGNVSIGSKIGGNIDMKGAVMVKGGSVDVYGTMKNPYFHDEITVDIQSTDNNHYVDHRTQDQVSGNNIEYKVQYNENFTGTDGKKTGLYIAKQYPRQTDSHTKITIDSTMFVHGGWTIQEWNTREDGSGRQYQPNDEVKLDELNANGDIEYTLTLYAIWTRSMYTVMYYPNVPLGVTYSGAMPNQPCTVGEVYAVPENQYWCSGYRFQGWNTKMDGTGKSYNTAASVQGGLSQENGATIKLYAQWSKCEHGAADLTYRINQNRTGLVQSCSCGAHTAEVALQTVDQVYDKKEHPVTLRYSGDTWSQALPDIQYEWRKAGTNDIYTAVNGKPKLAGQYQVTMTAPAGSLESETSSVRVTTHFIIEKAGQDAPESVTYTKEDGYIAIDPLTETSAEDGYHSAPSYAVTYTDADGNKQSALKDSNNPNRFDIRDFLMNTYWEISACYEETDNYRRSETTSTGFYASAKANVTFELPQGVTVEGATPPSGATDSPNSIWYYIKVAEGYHKDQFRCIASVAEAESGSCTFTYQSTDAQKGDLYQLTFTPGTGVTSNLNIKVTISGVKANAVIAATREAGQFFEQFDGIKQEEETKSAEETKQAEETKSAVAVNRDSAFTAQYDVENLNAEDYGTPAIRFSQGLPQETTIIMQTVKKSETGENAVDFCYYKVPEASAGLLSINLSEFHRMGGATERYGDFRSSENAIQIPESYRFVVDFSKASSEWKEGQSENRFDMILQFTSKKQEVDTDGLVITKLPELSGYVSVQLKAATPFSLEQTTSGSREVLVLTAMYAATQNTQSSLYTKRPILVIESSKTGEDAIPDDVRLEIQTENNSMTTVYPLNTQRKYIIPLNENSGEDTISMKLISDVYSFEGRTFSGITAKLYVSASETVDFSLQGNAMAELSGLSLTQFETSLPSIRIKTEKRLYESKDTIDLSLIESRNITDSDELKYRIWKKEEVAESGGVDQDYVDTGIGKTLNAQNSISLSNLSEGSYCLLITVSRTENENTGEGTVRTVMEVPYYFMIMDEKLENAS